MRGFDKKIKKLSKEFHVPETYHERVDEIMETIQKENVCAPKRRPFVKVAMVMMALCLLLTGYLCFSSAKVAEASFLETFKQTILDFFGVGEEDSQKMGIGSEKTEAVSKPDLMIELQEVVMDTQNIYAVVKITAPADIEFKEGMTFDYFGFCEGTNYNVSTVVPGARNCTLLEALDRKKNVATFVVSISTDKQIEEDKEVTVFFKDLLAGPYDTSPEVLVEGMWSLSFAASYTTSEDVTVKGTADMEYPFLGTTVTVTKVKLLPLGMTIVSDVSNVPADTLNTSDVRVVIRLKMIDGSEKIVDTPVEGEEMLVSSSSFAEYEKEGKSYHKYVCQFEKAIDTSQVLGVYIEDCYVPLKEFE